MRATNLMVAVLFALVSMVAERAAAQTCPNPKAVIEGVLSAWRSSDRFIDGGTLREEAELFVPVTARRSLTQCSQGQIVNQFRNSEFVSRWGLTLGDAENILKIRKIMQLTLQGRRPFVNVADRVSGFQDEIQGLTQSALNDLLRDLNLPVTSVSPSQRRSRNTFSYIAHKLKRMAFKSGNNTAIDNDLYAFTVAALFYNLGYHENHEAVFENSTRGANSFAFSVLAGQDQVLDLAEGLRFTRWDIETIREYVDKKMTVKPGFYEWLANWRFRGKIRMAPVGTLAFPGDPVLQVIADPASAVIMESLINPWMSTMTKDLTTAVQNLIAAGAIKVVVEGGTRRLVTGQNTSMTALLAGATGTSNVLMAKLLGGRAFGSVNHATMSAFPFQHEAIESLAANALQPMVGLPDTHNFLDGIRQHLWIAGNRLGTVRADSNIVAPDGTALSTLETIAEVRKLWRELRGREWNGFVTNDLTRKTLFDLASSGTDVEVVLMGGAFAGNPEVVHGNFVYKLVQMLNKLTGQVRSPIKIANGAKSTVPGEKDWYRYTDKRTGRFIQDLLTSAGQNPPVLENATSEMLLITGFADGRRFASRATIDETVPRIKGQLERLDQALTHPQATRQSLGDKNYNVVLSNELIERKNQAIADVTPKKEFRVLVVPGSFAPVTADGHIALARKINELFVNQSAPQGFDKIIFVPTGSKPVHGREYTLSGDARVEQLRRHVKTLPNAEVYTGEVETGGAYTIDTLNRIREMNPGAKVMVAMGEDVFWSIGRKDRPWKQADQVLLNHGIVVVERNGPDRPSDKADTLELIKSLGFAQKANGFVGPQSQDPYFHRIGFYNPESLRGVSSTVVRKFYDEQGISGLVHGTDPQWTFANRQAYPSRNQTANGTLSVVGTELTIDNITRLTEAALSSGVMKFSISSDAHFMVEINDPTQNGEFHAPFNFPQHGMANRPGPDGDRFITEVEDLLATRTVVKVPAHDEQVVDGKPQLVLAPFDLKAPGVIEHVKDVKSVVQFQKNGVGSYSVTVNPRHGEYLQMLDPYKVLPHFHFGWCTDFCDYWVMKRELELGYNVIFIVDAAAGVGAKTTGRAMRELLALGMKLMSTEEYLALNAKWKAKGAKWNETLNDLADWEKSSPTKARVLAELADPRYQDPAHPGDLGEGCAVFLKKK